MLAGRNDGVVVYSFETDSATMLIPNAGYPTYVDPGYLLYVAFSGGLFAQPFDLGSHSLTGPPTRVLDQVAATTGRRGYSVSGNGTLVYADGPLSTGGGSGEWTPASWK